MKRINHIFSVALMTMLLVLSLCSASLAAGTTINLSSKNPAVGDSITVTVTGASSSTITVRYNATVLNFSSCSAEGYSTDGNAITFTGESARIEFTAASEGTANVIVSSDTLDGSSTQVKVSGGAAGTDTDDTTDDDAAEEPADATADTATEGDFQVDGIWYVISERYTTQEMPTGFEKQSVSIHDKTYSEPANDAMTLVYLKPASDTSAKGEFYIYDAATDAITSKMSLLGDPAGTYVILTTPEELFDEALNETSFIIDETDYPAYQYADVANDFYFVYGMNEAQQFDWYQYDAANDTLQRANAELLTTMGAVEETEDDILTEDNYEPARKTAWDNIKARLGNVRLVVAFLIFALAVLLVIIIDIIAFRKKTDVDDKDANVFDEPDANVDLIGSDEDGLLDVEELDANEDETSELTEDEKEDTAESSDRGADDKDDKEASGADETSGDEDEAEDEEDEDEEDAPAPAPVKKRRLFFRKSQEDDIWAEPENEEEQTSKFFSDDDDDAYFNHLRNHTDEEAKIDVIDLNDL